MRGIRSHLPLCVALLTLLAALAGGAPPPRPFSFFGTVTAEGNGFVMKASMKPQ